MKRFLLVPLVVASLAVPALADAKDDVKAAAKKVGDAPAYTWTTTTEIEGSQWTPATITGKALKGGPSVITSEREGQVTTAVVQGEKGAVKTDEGWKTAEELRNAAGGGGGGGGRGGRGAMLLRTRPPADEAARIADKTKELKASDGVVSGDLTEEGAKELATLGRGRPGGQAPEARNAKGSVKYWIKDGQLSKMQLKVSATLSVNGEDRDMARTTTYEIKDVGATTVTVPDEAKKALGL
ncbi:MAG: hypothetical protein WCR07_00425 [Verrucomicrobiota bacterium]|jgi:hypothetical protein